MTIAHSRQNEMCLQAQHELAEHLRLSEDQLRHALLDIQNSEKRLNDILDNISACVCVKDMDGRYIYINQCAIKFWQTDKNTALGKTDYDFFSHETAEAFKKHDLQILAGEQASVSEEIGLTDKAGREFVFLLTKTPLKDSKGDIYALLVVSTNVTERKQEEDRLKLAHTVYQHSNDGIVVCDENNCIKAVNPTFTKVTGYSEQEVIGKTPKVLSSGRQSADFYAEMWNVILTDGTWQGEIWNRKKNGEEYAEWLTINTIFDDDGKVRSRVAIFSDVTEKKRKDFLIWKQVNYDPLTELPNRRLFMDRLGQEIKKAKRDQQQVGLLYIDLDRFKDVNDTFGHHIGDQVLIEASSRIQSCVRSSDTVARLAGDEFTVIITDLRSSLDLINIAESLVAALEKPFFIGIEQAIVSASIGLAIYPDDADNLETLLMNADQAMYAAKQRGRNRYSSFTPSMHEAMQTRMRTIQYLKSAVLEEQFELWYQPIVKLSDRKIFKAEALLRWHHPKDGFVSPAVFIPLAEETGVIHEIGEWVFHSAVEEVKRCQAIMGAEFQISINKSPVQFHGQKNIHFQWLDYLKSQGLDGHSIVVEITEGLLLDAETNVVNQLMYFRDSGIQVAIDDFGTGYSALAYLRKFDIDYLKIDQSFTRNLAPNNDQMVLCEAIITMAHKLGLRVIAEGIETQEQCDILTALECDYGQGYYFSKPLPKGDFEAMLLADGK